MLDDFSFGMNKTFSIYDPLFQVFRITLTFCVRTKLGFISLLRNVSWTIVMNTFLICEKYTGGWILVLHLVTSVCVCVCVYVCMYVCIVYVCVYVCMYIYIHI